MTSISVVCPDIQINLSVIQLRRLKQALADLLGIDETKGGGTQGSLELTGSINKMVRSLRAMMLDHWDCYYSNLLF